MCRIFLQAAVAVQHMKDVARRPDHPDDKRRSQFAGLPTHAAASESGRAAHAVIQDALQEATFARDAVRAAQSRFVKSAAGYGPPLEVLAALHRDIGSRMQVAQQCHAQREKRQDDARRVMEAIMQSGNRSA